jgi:hypothetical protein
MTHRFPHAAARVAQFPLDRINLLRNILARIIFSLIAGSLTLASAGCFHSGPKPISANPPTQQQMEAYADEQTALRNNASNPTGETQQTCDQLATATPGVEEVRINQGKVESRQWTLIGNGPDHRWVFVRTPDASAGGWAPKPGLDKLDFQPPLESALTTGSSHFLAYAPVQSQTPGESEKSSAISQVFGAPQGEFTWRGRKYSYTLTPQLPCFPQLQ